MDIYLDCICVYLKIIIIKDNQCKSKKHECICDIVDYYFYDSKGTKYKSKVSSHKCLSIFHECICYI